MDNDDDDVNTYISYGTYNYNLQFQLTLCLVGRDILVSIATRYGQDGPGNDSRVVNNFRTFPDQNCDPLKLLYSWVPGFFPGGKTAEARR
jgi:hypothetical protein